MLQQCISITDFSRSLLHAKVADIDRAFNAALISGAEYFKDVIEKSDDGYRFKVELVRRWIEKQR